MRSTQIKKIDIPSYITDPNVLRRFDQRQTVFGRMLYDEKASFYKKNMYDNVAKMITKHQDGYSRVEFARGLAAWTGYDYFHGAFSQEKLTQANNIMIKPELARYTVTDPVLMSHEIKKTAQFYGASLVGISRLNKLWIYSGNMDGEAICIPDKFEYAIVMAIAMDAAAIQMSPAYPACSESGLAYSRMAFCVACLAEFIRYLGYDAIPMGNDVALSIPLAIDAGLGELGRLGLLITPQYGPCVRLCKVFTDLPLAPDKPIEFGVTDFCKECNRCVEACEVDAIHKDQAPSYDVVCLSNNKGVLRWAVNHDKCYQFWIENGGDCSNCIAACPFDPRHEIDR